MAQDFRAAFGLGENDTTISTVDAQGVALAGVQGLYHLAQAQAAQLQSQQAQIDDLKTRLRAVEAQPAAIAPELPVANSQLPPLGWLLFGALALLNLGGLAGYGLARGAEGGAAMKRRNILLIAVLLAGLLAGGRPVVGAAGWRRAPA